MWGAGEVAGYVWYAETTAWQGEAIVHSNLIGPESYMELDEQILFGGNYLLQSEATLSRQSESAGCSNQ